MVESLAKHLHLNNAIERTIAKVGQCSGLFVIALLAMDDFGSKSTLLVKRTNVPRVVDRTRDCDKLMLRTTLAQLLELFETAIDNVLVAEMSKSDASAKPFLLLQF